MTDPVLRAFTPADGPACHALRRDAFLEAFRDHLDDAAARRGAESYDASAFTVLLAGMTTRVAERDGAVVGFCAVRESSATTAELLYLYIDPAARGARLGTELACRAEEDFLGAHPGVTTLVLDTAVPGYNQVFWERQGYRYVGESSCAYPDGDIPAVRLAKQVAKSRS